MEYRIGPHKLSQLSSHVATVAAPIERIWTVFKARNELFNFLVRCKVLSMQARVEYQQRNREPKDLTKAMLLVRIRVRMVFALTYNSVG